jgi:hypothetical protein
MLLSKKGANGEPRDGPDVPLVLRAFEQDIRAKVKNMRPETLDATDKEEMQSLDPKNALLSESDCDGGDGPDSPSSGSKETPKKRRLSARSSHSARRTTTVATDGLITIKVGTSTVDVGFHKGPGLQLEASATAVTLVLQFLHENYDVLLTSGRDAHYRRAESRKDGPHELLLPPKRSCKKTDPHAAAEARMSRPQPPAVRNGGMYMNKIRWDFRRCAFSVWWLDADGRNTRTTKGFEVPIEDHCGNKIQGKAYIEAKAAVLKKASEWWNSHDKSKDDRFQLD